jgi:iron-sulfur cluster assembly protein
MELEPNITPRVRRPRPSVVSLTEAAAEQVKSIMSKGNSTAEKAYVGLRVGVKQGGCAGQEYILNYAETIEPLDEVVTDKGVTVLIEPKAVLYLIGTVIDYETTKLASKFVFRNPNETDACGCGESVTIKPADTKFD